MPFGRRCDPLTRLAALLAAGIDPARALDIAARDADPRTARRLEAVARGVRDGMDPTELLQDERLLAPGESAAVSALATGGRWDHAVDWVATERERANRLRRRLRSGLVLPGAVVVIAAFAGPLPAAFAGELGPGGYARAVFTPIIAAGSLAWLGFRLGPAVVALVRRVCSRLRGVPTAGEREGLYHLLARLLAAGLPAAEALTVCARAVSSPVAQRLRSAAARARGGAAVVPVLAACGLIDPNREQAVLYAAEQAGDLPASLEQIRRQLGDRRQLREDLIAEWVPRAIYVLALVMALRFVL